MPRLGASARPGLQSEEVPAFLLILALAEKCPVADSRAALRQLKLKLAARRGTMLPRLFKD